SGAAAASYGSLAITDFKGFRDFGVIGGVGMVLCWLGSILFLPAASVAADRISALVKARERNTESIHASSFSYLATFLVSEKTSQVMKVSAGLTLASMILIVHAVLSDPIEYDFRKLRSERSEEQSTATQLNRLVGEVVDKSTKGGGIAVLLPNIEELDGIEK